MKGPAAQSKQTHGKEKPWRRFPRQSISGLTELILGESQTDLWGLVFPWRQPGLIAAKRATLIISRARLVCILFAFLTPLWIPVDILAFPQAVWSKLATGRVAVSAAFAILPLLFPQSDRMRDAYLAVFLLLAVPLAFFYWTYALFSGLTLELSGLGAAVAAGYLFLPFVLVGGLALFPLTALEALVYALPIILTEVAVGDFGIGGFGPQMLWGLVWLLLLMAGLAAMSAMSQLHYLAEITMKAAHDQLTLVYNRGTGMELLAKYFFLAQRNNSPLNLLFFDLDHFKSINDRFGHEAGDEALRNAAANIKKSIRSADLLIRFGGEEFIVALPQLKTDHPEAVLERLRSNGLGTRPDGSPLTASVGMAEFLQDQPATLDALIQLADQRMYRAKESGRDRLCHGDGEEAITAGGYFSSGT